MKIERTPDPRIVYIHDVFSQAECGQIIQLAESVGFNEPGRVVMGDGGGNVVNPRSRRCHEIWLDQHAELVELEQRLAERYPAIAELYRQNVATVVTDLVAEPPARCATGPPASFECTLICVTVARENGANWRW